MAFSFLPTMVMDAVTDINPNMLRLRGIRLLMLDFDNTLVPYTTSVPTEQVSNWLKAMQQDGLELCVVSNSRKPRVKVFCQQYGLNCITHARKPFPRVSASACSSTAIFPGNVHWQATKYILMFWVRMDRVSTPYWSKQSIITIFG